MAASLRAAINAKCRECIYDPKSGLGTWREQVRACTVTACGLYSVRPMPDKRDRSSAPAGAGNARPDGLVEFT